jgi:rubrerythrin
MNKDMNVDGAVEETLFDAKSPVKEKKNAVVDKGPSVYECTNCGIRFSRADNKKECPKCGCTGDRLKTAPR